MLMLNVRDFGARGDGCADDTPAVLAALQAASPGGTVFFPKGRYGIRPIRVPSHVTLLGQSSWGYVDRRNAQREEADPGALGNAVLFALDAGAPALLQLEDARGTRIQGLSFDGCRLGDSFGCMAAGPARGPQNLAFEDLRADHFTGNALTLRQVEGFAVRRCLFIQNGGHAMDVSGSRNGTVIDTQLSYNKGAGFYGIGGGMERFIILSNRIEGGHPGGVYLQGASGVMVNGNSFDTAMGPAVSFLECTGCTAAGNMARLSGHDQEGILDTHVLLRNCAGISITGNAFWGWPSLGTNPWVASYGVYGENLTDCIITQNTMLESCRTALIQLEGNISRVITENNAGAVYPWTPPCSP